MSNSILSVRSTRLSAKTAVGIVTKEANIRPTEVKLSRCSVTSDGLIHVFLKTDCQEVESYLNPDTRMTLGLLVYPVRPAYLGNAIYIRSNLPLQAVNY